MRDIQSESKSNGARKALILENHWNWVCVRVFFICASIGDREIICSHSTQQARYHSCLKTSNLRNNAKLTSVSSKPQQKKVKTHHSSPGHSAPRSSPTCQPAVAPGQPCQQPWASKKPSIFAKACNKQCEAHGERPGCMTQKRNESSCWQLTTERCLHWLAWIYCKHVRMGPCPHHVFRMGPRRAYMMVVGQK